MFAHQRQEHISTLVAQHRSVTVSDLADELGVTGETIRRDLAALEEAGVLGRVHGGAVHRDLVPSEEPLDQRDVSNTDAKSAIASTALDLLATDYTSGSIVLDAGTSTAAFAKALASTAVATGARPTIITHAAPIAVQLSSVLQVNLIGGQIRPLTGAAVGARTVATIQSIRPDVAVIGTNGLSAEFGLSTPNADEAAVKHALITAARRVVLLADATKFDQESLVTFGTLSEIDTLVSDAAPSGALARALDDAGVRVEVAS